MENAETVLVIIVSATLSLFLIVSIILVVKLIQLANKLKEIADKAHAVADKAQAVADNVEAATNALKKTAGPLAVGKFLMNIADTVIKKRKGGK